MNRSPLRPISEAEIRTYEEDGVVCLRGLFDREWTARMHDASLRFMASGIGRKRVVQKPGETATFYSNVFMCAQDPDFKAFRDASPAAEIAATLMRVERVRFWYDQLFIKEPGTSAPTQWHHDLPYWPFRGEHLASVWVAFTPVTKQSSGVEYLKGSHKWGKFYRPVTPDEDPAFANPDLFITPGQFGRVRVPMSQTRPTMLVPDAAVVTDQSVKLLFTVNAEDTVVPKPVELGAVTDDGLRIIRSGIAADDRVIINGLLRARPGAKVTPEEGVIGAPAAPQGAPPS